MADWLKSNDIRYSLSLIIALIFSLVINYSFAARGCFLIPLTALFTMQTSVGNSFYQGMKKFAIVILMVATASLLMYSISLFYEMAHDVLIGALIGITANSVLLPRQPDAEFREKILPTIKILNDYFSDIIDQMLDPDSNKLTNSAIENALLILPDWVYERGFDSILQTGYRFFLIKVEEISDVLFSMHHLSRYQYDKELIAKIKPTLLQYVDHINQFFNSVITVLELKTLTEEPVERELNELHNQFFSIVPSSLELLYMRRDYVYLAAFIYNLKELRQLLLRMGESLR